MIQFQSLELRGRKVRGNSESEFIANTKARIRLQRHFKRAGTNGGKWEMSTFR